MAYPWLIGLLILWPSLAFGQANKCLLNCGTPITIATPNAVLVGDSSHNYVPKVVPTTCATPGGLVFNGGSFACSATPAPVVGAPIMSARITISAATTSDRFFANDRTDTTSEADVQQLITVAGTIDSFCCHQDTGRGATVTYTPRLGGSDASGMSVTFTSGQSGTRCDTLTDSASVAASTLFDFRANLGGNAGSGDIIAACGLRFR